MRNLGMTSTPVEVPCCLLMPNDERPRVERPAVFDVPGMRPVGSAQPCCTKFNP